MFHRSVASDRAGGGGGESLQATTEEALDAGSFVPHPREVQAPPGSKPLTSCPHPGEMKIDRCQDKKGRLERVFASSE